MVANLFITTFDNRGSERAHHQRDTRITDFSYMCGSDRCAEWNAAVHRSVKSLVAAVVDYIKLANSKHVGEYLHCEKRELL